MNRLICYVLVWNWVAILLIPATLVQSQDDPPNVPNVDEAVSSEQYESFLRGPLTGRNQFPFALMVLTLSPERAQTLHKGLTVMELNLDYSNIIALQFSERNGVFEELSLDLEYLRVLWGLRHGLNESTEISFGVPLYVFHGGFLDPFIDGFHRAFGLPNAVRGDTPFGLTSLSYSIDGVPSVARSSPFASVGDIEATIKRRLFVSTDRSFRLAARSGVKIPTGSVERGSGSGAFDAAFGVALEKLGRRFGGYANINYHFLGHSNELATKSYASIALALDFRFKENLNAVFQVEQLQPFVDGGLKLFNQPARQFSLGLRYRASPRFLYEWRFVEDLSTTSPDFSFGFQWRWLLGTGGSSEDE